MPERDPGRLKKAELDELKRRWLAGEVGRGRGWTETLLREIERRRAEAARA